jgi:uncharacterized membrane protein YdbT with pleckstrin-like domain
MDVGELLDEDEDVILEVRPHWSTVARPVLGSAAVVAAAVSVVAVVPALPEAAWIAVAAVLVVSLAWLGGRYVRWTSTRLVVTTLRVISQQGVLRRRWHQTPVRRITDVGVEQRLTERALGKGSLLVESGGEHGAARYVNVPRPWQVQRAISRQMDDAHHKEAAGPAPAGVSVVDQIDKLDELWRRGVITDAEFETLRSGLLGRS